MLNVTFGNTCLDLTVNTLVTGNDLTAQTKVMETILKNLTEEIERSKYFVTVLGEKDSLLKSYANEFKELNLENLKTTLESSFEVSKDIFHLVDENRIESYETLASLKPEYKRNLFVIEGLTIDYLHSLEKENQKDFELIKDMLVILSVISNKSRSCFLISGVQSLNSVIAETPNKIAVVTDSENYFKLLYPQDLKDTEDTSSNTFMFEDNYVLIRKGE